MKKYVFAVLAAVTFHTALAAPARAQICASLNECGDVDDSGLIAASDALKVLRKSVGLNATLTCNCGEPPYDIRFDTSGATIIDHQTGLEWEKKDSADGSPNLVNPHDADNTYTWQNAPTLPDGTAFTDFLVRLNSPIGPGLGSVHGVTDTGCYANHCDWRLPTIEEMQPMLQGSYPSCGHTPCIVPAFSPGDAGQLWTMSSLVNDASSAWSVNMTTGAQGGIGKQFAWHVRAVRGESH